MQLELAGKVVLICGASGGLGRELALCYGRQQAAVVVHYRRHQDAAEVVAQSVEAVGGDALTLQADLADRASVEGLVNDIKKEWGGVDVLITCPSAFEGSTSLESLTPAQWNRMLDVMLTGIFHVTSLVTPYMRAQKWGRIVHVAARSGLVGTARQAHYSAAKAGLIGFTRAVAKELGPDGILVNAVAPTIILTPAMRESMSIEAQERMAKSIPVGRIATPDDIARVVLFLGSGWNTFVSGEVISVSGGAQT